MSRDNLFSIFALKVSKFSKLFIIFFALSLVACGGGGGKSNTSNTTGGDDGVATDGGTDDGGNSSDGGSNDGGSTGGGTDNGGTDDGGSTGGGADSGGTTDSGSDDGGDTGGGSDDGGDTGGSSLSKVTLSGTVSGFPDTDEEDSVVAQKSYKAGAYKTSKNSPLIFSKPGDDGTLSREDMVPEAALVSIFLISDVNFETPIATVPTDETGIYEITAEDVVDYLVEAGLVAEDADEEAVITAFRSLGQLQVRALIVKEDGDDKKALAIQSIADPLHLDESGEPVPSAVDPIVHRLAKPVIDQVQQSIASLGDLGLSETAVTQLTRDVISNVAGEITRVVQEAGDSVIEIPEGQTVEDIIAEQESGTEIIVGDEELSRLEEVIDGTSEDQESAIEQLESDVLTAEEVVADLISNQRSSLGSTEQGLLASLEALLNDNVADELDAAIADAELNGTLDSILNIGDGQTAEEVLAAQTEEVARQLANTLRGFFLTMGLGVVVDENEAGDAAVVAINLDAPFHIANTSLPGGAGFGNRSTRIFKVGPGVLDSDSDYTSDSTAVLGVLSSDDAPQAPFYYAPEISGVLDSLLGDRSFEAFQTALDSAFARISDPAGSPTSDDYTLVDVVRIYGELNARLKQASFVSSKLIDVLVENKDSTVKIKRLAASVAENFTWVNESVNVTPEGFPVFNGRRTPLIAGKDVVDSSELVRALSFTLASSPSEAAAFLTERISFYGQFAPSAVQSAIQQASFEGGENFDLLETLLNIYPTEASQFRDLIVGTDLTPGDASYVSARDLVVRGLISAVPSTLFGKTLTSETDINIRSALFFINFLLSSSYAIDPQEGFFKEFVIVDDQDLENARFIPHFNNIKRLDGNDVSVSTMVSDLLNITDIDNGELFRSIRSTLSEGISGLPELPENKEQDIDDFADDIGNGRADLVSLSCTVEKFDGSDPASPDNPAAALKLTVFEVIYDSDTGEFRKSDAIEVGILSESFVGSDNSIRRTYTLSGLSSEVDGVYGRDYVIRFGIDNYQNDLPELFFFVDGFVEHINFCDPESPLYIGQDQQFVPAPGVSIVNDQFRPSADGETELAEGIDLSNFEEPGAPIYITGEEEADGLGSLDFTFIATDDGYSIEGTDEVGFAPLFGDYVDGVLELDVVQGELEPLFGLFSINGANIRTLIEDLIADDSALSSSIDISFDPETFEYDRLYIMRDAEGRYWVIELRFLEEFTDGDETKSHIDIGFMTVNALGDISTPVAAFEDFGGAPGEEGEANLFYQSMFYGDWLVLDPPTDYDGPTLFPAEEVSFGGAEAIYGALETATDGIVIRYAGNHFEANITGFDDFEEVFGDPADYSSIPVRLDAGRDGLSFVKLSFDKSSKSYVMEPAPESSTEAVTNLAHDDIVAIFDDNFENGESPVYLGRVVRHLPVDDPYANFDIAFEWTRFADVDTSEALDPRNVVCFTEETEGDDEGRECPSTHPELAFASDLSVAVGSVFDEDFDGVPALFDPNDSDPNVPGSPVSSVGAAGGGFDEGIFISAQAESNDEGGVDQFFVLETFNVYPGDIQSVSLVSPVFGEDSDSQVIFVCSSARLDDEGNFIDYACTARDVEGDVVVEQESRTTDSVTFSLNVDESVLAGLGDFVVFDYEVNYRAPTDLNGNPFMCGVEPCLARPNTFHSQLVRIPEAPVVISDLSITIGTEEPSDLSSITSLDVSREFLISGSPIPGAVDYELTIFCAGSSPGGADYLPEENWSFHAPAKDETGRLVQPEFYLNIPWIGGRTCDIKMTAVLENEAGDQVGTSSLSLDGITTTGGYGDGGFVENELDLSVGDEVCLEEDTAGNLAPIVKSSGTENLCLDSDIVFSLVDLIPGDADTVATIDLGSSVTEFKADGGRKDLTSGVLSSGSVVAINVDLNVGEDEDVQPPTCGSISTDDFSNTCGENDADVSTNFLEVDDSLAFLTIHPEMTFPMAIINPEGTIVDGIPMDVPGFYLLQETENGEVIMEINIDVFSNADGENEVWANITLTAGVNEFREGDSVTQFDVSSPGYMRFDTSSGQPVEFDIVFVRDSGMRLAWYLPAPELDLEGDHDLNSDGQIDLNASYETGMWTYTFFGGDDGVLFLEHFLEDGIDIVEANDEGNFVVFVEEDAGYANFGGQIGEQGFYTYSHVTDLGEASLSFDTFFNGGFDPTDPNQGCDDCSHSLAESSIEAGILALSLSDDGSYNFEGEGEVLANFEVTSDGIVVSLPEGNEGATLEFFDFSSNEMLSSSSFSFDREGSFYLVNYRDTAQDDRNVDFDIQDFGVDVNVRVLDAFDHGNGDGGAVDGGTDGGSVDGGGDDGGAVDGGDDGGAVDGGDDGGAVDGGDDGGAVDGGTDGGAVDGGDDDFVNPDLDDDGFLNEDDNCELIPNDQADENANGIGDACDIDVSDMSGTYFLDINYTDESTDLNEFFGTCDPQNDEAFFVEVEMVGNQIYIKVPDEDDVYGVMETDDSFELFNDEDDFVANNGVFNTATGVFTIDISESESTEDESLTCSAEAAVTGTPVSDVSEQTVLETGVSWFESDDDSFSGESYLYGTIQTGAVETLFVYDESFASWELEAANDPYYYLTANGLELVQDRFVITGFVDDTETAIMQLTDDTGEASFVQTYHLNLKGVDVSAKGMAGLLGEDFEYSIVEGAQFSAGAQAYQASFERQQNAYVIDCDSDSSYGLGLDCENFVTAAYDESGIPQPATSLEQLVLSEEELESATAFIRLGEGYSEFGGFSIDAIMSSDDGTLAGANLTVSILQRSYDPDATPELLTEIDALSSNIGEYSTIEFEIPDEVAEMADLDDEDRVRFVFVESELEGEGGVAMVRHGRKELEGSEGVTQVFNDIAKDDILNNFVGSFDGGETGGFDGGETGGFDGGETGGFDGGETGGSDGGETGGFDGGETGGFDGGETGGFDGGETGGFDDGGDPF